MIIRFNETGGKRIYINTDHVQMVEVTEDGTIYVRLRDGVYLSGVTVDKDALDQSLKAVT